MTPSNANCGPIGPWSGDTNCGSSTEQNSRALGLSTLVSTPASNAPPSPDPRGGIPPTVRAASNAHGWVLNRAARPNAANVTWAARAMARPTATANACPRPRNTPVSNNRMMSGPGTTYTISKAPRNIAISALTALSPAFCKAIILEKSGWHVLAIHANPITMIGIFIFLINLFLKSMPKRDLDAYDRRILEALQQNGRLTNVELAEQIGLSPSPCLRRVRMLEEAGVIQGYEARLAPDEVGLGLTVFVGVKVERHHERDAEQFRTSVYFPGVVPDPDDFQLDDGQEHQLQQMIDSAARAAQRGLR
ncbi:hypothetical protein G6F57_016163 [Rhizopus arrhizus]|nr:hypothetical protein G6F57_016163 [Rhizopus arrhizus]